MNDEKRGIPEKLFGGICWAMWKIGDVWDWLVADIRARWETRGMNADQIIAHVKDELKDVPQDRAAMVMSELCETLEKARSKR